MKTVFVVGAGASSEAKLPTGSELKELIARALNIRDDFLKPSSVDATISRALSIVVKTGSPYSVDTGLLLTAAQRIHRAMPQAISIDNFIDSHSGDKEIEFCGKLAIVRTVLEAEAKSDVFVGHRLSGSKVEFKCLAHTWFHGFFQLLTDGCKVEDLPTRLDSMAFIIFNYDRCIEQYLYYALQSYYHMDDQAAATLLQRLEIYHPYGTVGSIPWLPRTPVVPFGHDPSPDQLLRLTKNIKTFTEGTDESASDVKAIRSHMETATNLVFLGFAFHPLNMNLLLPQTDNPSKVLSSRRHIYATAHGISDSNKAVIAEKLKSRTSITKNNIQVRNELKCCQLIKEYSLSLSLA
jgi:hypothetical protein